MPPEKTLIEVANRAAEMDFPWSQLWRYALGAVVGGAGGCVIAAALKAKGVKITRWIVLSYAAIGSFAAVLFLAYFYMNGWIELTIENIIVRGGTSALIVVGIISGINVSLHFSARKFAKDSSHIAGIKVEMETDETQP